MGVRCTRNGSALFLFFLWRSGWKKKTTFVCVPIFFRCGCVWNGKKKKRWKKMGWICNSVTDSTYNHRKDLVIAYSSSSRRAMDGWNSAVSSSKMTSKLWPRRRRPISAGLSVQCRSVGQQPAFFLLLSLSSIFLHRSKENKRTQKNWSVGICCRLSSYSI